MSFNKESQLLLLEINLNEGVKLHGLKAALTFVNFGKTFAASAMVECLAFWVYCVANRIVHTKDLVYDGTRSCVLKPDGNTDYLLVFYKTTCSYKLWHMKNKGVQQLHVSSWNSKAIDVWKVAQHPPRKHVVACDDYPF